LLGVSFFLGVRKERRPPSLPPFFTSGDLDLDGEGDRLRFSPLDGDIVFEYPYLASGVS
jgi:hypothetical protein